MRLRIVYVDENVPEIVKQLTERAGQEFSSLGMGGQHLLDLADVADPCFAYQFGHGIWNILAR
jgi:hypothetical protein